MKYMILDSTGSAINEYGDVVSAHAAMRAIVADDETAADHVMLLTYDDEGNVVGDAITFAELPLQTASIQETPLVFVSWTRACDGEPSRYAPAPAEAARQGNVAAAVAAA